MKRIAFILCTMFIGTIAHGDTLDINWYVDNQIYQTGTCEIGGNVTPPTAPDKYGYTFQEWLPYIPIEYLESTGTQWIDTDTIMYSSDKINVEITLMRTSDMSYTSIFGAQNGNARSILAFDGKIYCGDGSRRLSYSLPINEKHKILIEYINRYLTVYLDDVFQSGTSTSGDFANRTFNIFKLNGGDGVFVGRIYSFKYLIHR